MDLNISINKLYEKNLSLKEKDKYYRILNFFSTSLLQINSETELVWFLAKKIISNLDFQDCVIYLRNAPNKKLVQKAAYGPKNPMGYEILNPLEINFGEGIVGTVALNQKAEIINDTRKDSRYILDDNNRCSEIAVPIIYENELLGVIDSEHSDPNFYTKEHLQLLKTIAAMSATKINQIRIEEKLKKHQVNLEKTVNHKTEKLNQTIQLLHQSNDYLRSFSYAVSHDLKEPLRTIKTYLQLFDKSNHNLLNSSEKYFQSALTETLSMENFMDSLLEYSKLECSKEKYQNIAISDMLLIINNKLEGIIPNLKLIQKNINNVYGDFQQIKKMFLYCILTFKEFLTHGNSLSIEISSIAKKRYIHYTLKSMGNIISENILKKMLHLLELKPSEEDEFEKSMNCLRLVICKRIIKYHQGTIDVVTDSSGTSFRFSLPKSI